MHQNSDIIAGYGAPPHARVIWSSSKLDGQPYSADMIYGGQQRAAEYEEMVRQMRIHTNDQRIRTPFGEGLSDEAFKEIIKRYQNREGRHNIIQSLPEELRDGISYQLTYYILNVEEEGQVWEDAPEYTAFGFFFGLTAVGVEAEVVGSVLITKVAPKLVQSAKSIGPKAKSLVENTWTKVKNAFGGGNKSKKPDKDNRTEGKEKAENVVYILQMQMTLYNM
ncbi:hypothetical protein KO561_00965 [Radiobacillus kanasensis]|uniref:hypothetical protein n=1 Tax=Radiobacillus kanasensis TaxID=2844358 RepID=UPI001E40A0AC|nr:hypothetical protein [Radiobacillus kanasensis]UFT99581.1 hypothetical protein KO561_00965 [Radiobacillus kanasensis]